MTEMNLKVVEDPKIAEKLQALFSPQKDKIGDLMSEDILETLEYASIYQPTTRSISPSGVHSGIRMGEIYTKYGVVGKDTASIPLVMWNSRSYYDRNKNEQLCSSPNGLTPVHQRLASKCATCRYQRYSRGSPSLCTKFLNILMLQENLKAKPYVLQFSRTSYRIGTDIAKQAKGFGDNLYDCVFELTTKQAEGAAYFKWTVASVRPVQDDLKAALGEIQKHYFNLVSKTISRYEVTAEDAEADKADEAIEAPENIE